MFTNTKRFHFRCCFVVERVQFQRCCLYSNTVKQKYIPLETGISQYKPNNLYPRIPPKQNKHRVHKSVVTLGLLDQSFIGFFHETLPALQNVTKMCSDILDIGGFNFYYNVGLRIQVHVLVGETKKFQETSTAKINNKRQYECYQKGNIMLRYKILFALLFYNKQKCYAIIWMYGIFNQCLR